MRKDRRMGIHWTLTKQLEDQDFADDISLLAHRHEEAQTKLQHVAYEAEKVGLQININKTEVMRVNYNRQEAIQLQGKEINVSYRVFNCILVHFIPLPVFIFYSFFFFILFYLLFFHVHCTGLFFLFFFFISILFLSTRFPCSLYQRGWDCTGVGGTIPRGQSLCESMSLCRCLVFILCMPVCNYTLRLTLCAVYG